MRIIFTLVSIIFLYIPISCKRNTDDEYLKSSKVRIEYCNEQTIEDLVILCKVWGFLKYYHPAVAKGEYNWDFELFKIMPSIINVKSKKERNDILLKWIDDLGKIQEGKPLIINCDSVKMCPDLEWIMDETALSKEVVTRLYKISKVVKEHNHYISINKETNITNFGNEEVYANLEDLDIRYRLLSLFRYWNVIQYYYPYRYLLKEDWETTLYTFIPQFIDAESMLEYKKTTLRLVSQIPDSHVSIYDQSLFEYWGVNIAPYEISYVENKMVVVDCLTFGNMSKPKLKKGDIILSVNNENVDSIIKWKLSYTPGSNRFAQLRDISTNLLRTNTDKIFVKYSRDFVIHEDTLVCYSFRNLGKLSKFNKDKPYFQILKDNIGYFYPGSLQEKSDITEKDMLETDGIIIDLRCYPNPSIAQALDYDNFLRELTKIAKYTLGSIENPGLFTFQGYIEVGKNKSDSYMNKKVVLVNEITQSWAESLAMLYSCTFNTTIIGSTTAGADGGRTDISLPGGLTTTFTGYGYYYADGNEVQGIGIIPDIEVKPTIKGVREGRDEVLEKAIKLLINKR